MALTDDALNSMGDQLGTDVTQISLHSADPGTTGANETTAGRQTPTWSAAASGDLALSAALNFTGGAGSGACTHVGMWDAGGVFQGGGALSGDQAFNASGEYTLDSLTVAGT